MPENSSLQSFSLIKEHESLQLQSDAAQGEAKVNSKLRQRAGKETVSYDFSMYMT